MLSFRRRGFKTGTIAARHFDNKIQTKYKDKAKQIGLEIKSQEVGNLVFSSLAAERGPHICPEHCTATLRWVYPGEGGWVPVLGNDVSDV